MQFDQLLHQRKPDPQSSAADAAHIVRLPEHLEDDRLLVRGDADAIVLDRQNCIGRAFDDRDLDPPAIGCVAGRIAHDVPHDLDDACRIGMQRDLVIGQGNRQRVPAGIDRRLRDFQRVRKNIAERDLFPAQGNLPVFDPVDIEQIIDQTRHVAHVLPHRRVHGCGVGFVHRHFQQGHARRQDRQRVAQFMREHAEEPVLLPVGRLKCCGQGGKLVALDNDLLALDEQVEEDVRLGLQDRGFDRLLDEIDRARFVTVKLARRIPAACGQEDDRNMPRTRIGAHDFGQLETIHSGHLHVEQGKRIFVRENKLERFLAAAGTVQLQTLARQQGFEGKEVFLKVVDQQEFGSIGHCSTISMSAAGMSLSVIERAAGDAASAACGM